MVISQLQKDKQGVALKELIEKLATSDALGSTKREKLNELLDQHGGEIAGPILELADKLVREEGVQELVDAILFELQTRSKNAPHLLSRDVLKHLASLPNLLSDRGLASVVLMLFRVYPEDIPPEGLTKILELTERFFRADTGDTEEADDVVNLLYELWATLTITDLSSLCSILKDWSSEIGWNRVSCLFLAELIVHEAALQSRKRDECIALFEEISSRKNDAGVKEEPPSKFADKIRQLSSSQQQMSKRTSHEITVSKWSLAIVNLVALLVPAIIAAYRVMRDPIVMAEGTFGIILSFGAEFIIALLCFFALLYLVITILSWIKTIRMMGIGSVHAFLPMLKMRDASRFILTPSFRRNPWWVNLIVQYLILGLLFLLAIKLVSPVLLAVTNAVAIVLIVRLLDSARPPGVLLLGPSTNETIVLQSTMNSMSHSCPVVSLLDVNRLENNIGPSAWTYTGKVFRTVREDPYIWFSTVQEFARISAIIVIDARHPSRVVLQELLWILQSEHAYKLICIIGDYGHASILKWLDMSKDVLKEQGVLLVTETKLYDVIWDFTKSAKSLPSPEHPASHVRQQSN